MRKSDLPNLTALRAEGHDAVFRAPACLGEALMVDSLRPVAGKLIGHIGAVLGSTTIAAQDLRRLEALWELAHSEGVRDCEAFLDRQPELPATVRGMFQKVWHAAALAEADPSAPTAKSSVEQSREATVSDHLIGRTFGAYQLLQVLGDGGAGTVFFGERREAEVHHVAAVKVLHHRFRPQSSASREFQREQKLLSRLVHPYIAQFIDSGLSEDGLAYIVVELVRGEPISDYLRKRELVGVSALKLFANACRAVEFAHRQLIVHRDLKPSNILVDTETATPKLLDFGIAKEMTGDSTSSEHTGTFACTPNYASPEQLSQSEWIGTSTDIYSLGVLLYELVFGAPPLAGKSLSLPQRLALMEQMAVPRIDARSAPSWSEAMNRGQCRDLERVLSRAMAVDPAARYESAQELAEDIDRLCVNLPIEAAPVAWTYRLSRFAARRSGALIAASGALLVLAAAGTSYMLQARKTAEQATRLSVVTGVLSDILTSPDPLRRGKDVRLVDVIDQALPRIEQDRTLAPSVRADIDEMLGQTFLHLGRLEDADRLLQRAAAFHLEAHGVSALQTLHARLHAAALSLERGRYDAAHAELQEIVEVLRREHPQEREPLARALTLLGNAEIYANEAFETAISNMEEAQQILAQSGSSDTAQGLLTQQSLGLAYSMKGDLASALEVQESVLARMSRLHGDGSAYEFDARNNLGRTLQKLGRTAEAESLLKENAAFAERIFGEQAPDTLMAWNNLGVLYWQMERPAEAAALFERVVIGRETTLGERHPRTLMARSNLADALVASGDVTRACALAKEAHQALLEVEGSESSQPGHPEKVYARCLAKQGNVAAAITHIDAVLALWSRTLGEGHLNTLGVMHDRARILLQAGRREEAVSQLRTEVTLREGTLGLDHPQTVRAKTLLAETAGRSTSN